MSVLSLKMYVLIIVFSIIFIISSCIPESPSHWPSNNTNLQNVTWEIPLSDSAKVLKVVDRCWILPEPEDSDRVKTTTSIYRSPLINEYDEHLGYVDQEVIQSSTPKQKQYYRFMDGAVYFIGYTSSDSSKALTFFNPPLMLLPDNFEKIPFEYKSVGSLRYLNKISGKIESGQKNRVAFKIREKGCVTLDSGQINAWFCEMSLSSDRTVGFGETDLIVPDAILIRSNLIITEGKGTVLEWGIRSRNIEMNSQAHPMPGRELYIEITRHIKETKRP